MTLQELKRGMRCTERSGLTYIVDKVEGDKIYFIYPIEFCFTGVNSMGDDLKSKTEYDCVDIMKVEDIGKDGYKTIWERKEEKYYLKLPNGYHYNTYLQYSPLSDRFYFADKEESKDNKTQFTLSEIKNLPNQDFVKALEKEEVVE